ncbi:MAG: uracil-DNA glycosylase [Planctomycetota bacterium]
MDAKTWRAIRLAVEAEAAFGIDVLPKGPKIPVPVDSSTASSSLAPLNDPPISPAKVEPRAQVAPAADTLLRDASSTGKSLEDIAAAVATCEACSLCETRTKTVPGQGHAKARLMFVGEAPGYNEDQEGLAFVGPAGQLLTKMIKAMGLSRDEVFIANILKCRPPENRVPRPEEAQACFHFLLDQIDAVNPEVICALGGQAANNLLKRSDPMYQLRGKIFDFEGRQLVPTYHPSYLLRSPHEKAKAWSDLQVVMKLLALPTPKAS